MHDARKVRDAVDNFLAIVRAPEPASEADLRALQDALDRLSPAARSLTYAFEDGHPDPPRADYTGNLADARRRFPGLGFYNVPERVAVSPCCPSTRPSRAAATDGSRT